MTLGGERHHAAGRVAAALWLMAAVLYLGGEAATAVAFSPPYSYATNYISDLGVPTCGTVYAGRSICSPRHALMNATFIVQGVLFVAAALAVSICLRSWTRYLLVTCAALEGIGIIVIGLYPETTTSALGGLNVHILGALLAIVFGNVTAMVSIFGLRELDLPRLHRWISVALPMIAVFALAMLITDATEWVPSGIWERTSVYTITAWELLTGACLLYREGREAR